MFHAIRSALDFLYRLSGILAATSLVAILLLIVAQMTARWTGQLLPGASSYAGYAMAAASFLAFADALNKGAHIRVSALLEIAASRPRFLLEAWSLGISTAIAWYFAWSASKFTYWSWKFNDISQAQDAAPLWIPQSFMVVGSVIFAVALTDHLLHLLVTGKHRIQTSIVDQSFAE